MKDRFQYLDNSKAILIVLVILGHVIQGSIEDYQHNPIFRFIYSFHMPLFLAISGYLTYKPKYDSGLIKKRAVQLLVPFVIWAFLSPILQNGVADIDAALNVLLYPDNGLWFLYNLFVYSAFFNISEWISEKFAKKQELILCAFVFLLVCAMAVFKTKFNCSQLCWYLPFFVIGYYMRKYSELVEKRESLILMLGGAIFVVGMPFWMMREDPLFYKWINLGVAFAYLYRWVVMMAGCVFFFILGKRYLNMPLKLLNKLGRKTLGIYALQFTILHYLGVLLPVENLYMNILFQTVACVIICYFLTVGIGKIKYLRTILIGEK